MATHGVTLTITQMSLAAFSCCSCRTSASSKMPLKHFFEFPGILSLYLQPRPSSPASYWGALRPHRSLSGLQAPPRPQTPARPKLQDGLYGRGGNTPSLLSQYHAQSSHTGATHNILLRFFFRKNSSSSFYLQLLSYKWKLHVNVNQGRSPFYAYNHPSHDLLSQCPVQPSKLNFQVYKEVEKQRRIFTADYLPEWKRRNIHLVQKGFNYGTLPGGIQAAVNNSDVAL